MSLLLETETEPAAASIPRAIAEPRINPPRLKPLRVGLLGLGNVGRAVARQLTSAAPLFARLGFVPRVTAALMRDAHRSRLGVPEGCKRFDRVEAFLAQGCDVVIEVLGGVEPAATIVDALLRRGTPVVTANKSLLAERGEALLEAAARGRTALRCEASVLAGVPLLGALRQRPLVARARTIVGIVNGTSNYVLSRVDRDRLATGEAVRRAIAEGLAEPDPSFDLSGRDSAEKLIVLLQHLGASGVRRERLETAGVDVVSTEDLAQARVLGGVLKPVVAATLGDGTVDAFVGPAWLPNSHALADIDDCRNAVVLSGPRIGELLFAGPGAGPDVTAATIVDDLIEIVSGGARLAANPPAQPHLLREATTAWFIRVELPRGTGTIDDAHARVGSRGIVLHGLPTLRTGGERDLLYLLTKPCATQSVRSLARDFEAAGAARVVAFRALSRA